MADPAAQLWDIIKISAGVGGFVGGGVCAIVAALAQRKVSRLKSAVKHAIESGLIFSQEIEARTGVPSERPPSLETENTVNLLLEEQRMRARAERLRQERLARNPLDDEIDRRARLRDAEDAEYARRKVDALERPLRRYSVGKEPEKDSTPPESLPQRAKLPPRR